MASATKKTEKKSVLKPVYEEVTVGVTITLDKDEAQFLADILAKVGGSPKYSRRRFQPVISEALASAGINSQYPLPDIDRHHSIMVNDDIPGNDFKSL